MRVPISAKESTVLWKTLASVLFKGIMKAAALAIALVAAAIVIQQTTSARNKGREINSLQAPGQQHGGGETMGNELNLISQAAGPGNMAIPPMSSAMIPMVVGQLGQALGRTAAMVAKTFAMRKRKSSAAAAASSRPRNTEYPHGGGGTNGNTFAGGGAASSRPKNMEYPYGSGGTNGSTFAGGGVMGTSNQPGPAQSVTGNSRVANSIPSETNLVQEYRGEGYSVGNATQWE
ncbi:hypothetical protein MRX96_059632 [Rhipicephalus microplus]